MDATPEVDATPEPAALSTQDPVSAPSERFFWAKLDEGRLLVQVLHIDDELWTYLDEAGPGPVAQGAPWIPDEFQVGDEYRVANSTGVHAAQLSGFEVGVHPDQGHPILLLVLSPLEPVYEEGLAVRADGPRLTPLRPMKQVDSLSADYLHACDELGSGIRYEDEELEYDWGPEVIPARFPPPYEVLVNVAWSVPEPSIFGEIVSGLLVGYQGRLTDFPEEVLHLAHDYQLHSFTDINDDGFDDFLVEIHDNYEDRTRALMLYVWEGDRLMWDEIYEGEVFRPSWGGADERL